MYLKAKRAVLFLLCLLTILNLTACGDEEESVDSVKAADLTSTASVIPTSTIEPTASKPTASKPTPSEPTLGTSTSEEDTQPPTPTADPNVVVFDVAIHDGYYGDKDNNMIDPPIWYVEPGKIILINAENDGTEKHNWVIVKQAAQISSIFDPLKDSDIVLYDPGMVYAKSKTTLTITAPPVGSYAIICTVAGHYPYMQGRLVVSN